MRLSTIAQCGRNMEEATVAVFPHVSFKGFFKNSREGKKEASSSSHNLLFCKVNPKKKIPGKGSQSCLFTKTEFIYMQRLNSTLK